ncbi:MAG: HEPN domain-containing protein [Desulfovibrionales bacterium]
MEQWYLPGYAISSASPAGGNQAVNERSKELVSYRMARAEESLEDARILTRAGRWNTCVNRLYYACFYAVSALLLRDGLSSSKHAGIRGLFNKNYVKTGKVPEKSGQNLQ